MSNKIYAIIDIETTGIQAQREKITEIAIVLHDGKKVVDTYETLINPERSIPYQITQVTGINDEMVANAPKFYEVAKQIVKLTEGAIFVAHNVRFDYSFVVEEFRRLGFTYSRKQLCTVKLSRKAFPNLRSYSLGSLIHEFNIPVKDRHRALEDALATAQIFTKILSKEENYTEAAHMINLGIKETQLPTGISLEKLHSLPESCGIYYMHDEKGTVIYVGKSINIKKRLFEHFTDKTPKGDKIQQSVFDITYEETGSEIIALLLEDYEIKRLKPAINRAQRKTYFPYAIFSYKDEKGYMRLHTVKNVATVRSKQEIILEFTKLLEAKSFLKAFARRYELCEKLMENAVPTEGGCLHYQIGQCHGACIQKETLDDYNARLEEALQSFVHRFENDFFIIDEGRTEGEKAVVMIKDGVYYGYGYIDSESFTHEDLFESVKKYPNNRDIHKIIRTYIQQNKKGKILKF